MPQKPRSIGPEAAQTAARSETLVSILRAEELQFRKEGSQPWDAFLASWHKAQLRFGGSGLRLRGEAAMSVRGGTLEFAAL